MAEQTTREVVETRNGYDIVKRTKRVRSETGRMLTASWWDVMKGRRIVEKKIHSLTEARRIADRS